VLGVTDHDGYIHSIYFFDPNGFRVELTAEVVAQSVLEGFRRDAHGQLAAWNSERKAARAT